MPLYWQSATTQAITRPTWTSSTQTTSTGGLASLFWASNSNVWTSGTASPTNPSQYYWATNAGEWQEAQTISQIWPSQSCLSSLFRPARPALVTHQDQRRLDEQLYRRAVAEHDEQEAARLLRVIEQHARTQEDAVRLLDAHRQRHREDQDRRAAAKLRARELLREHLTPQQLETFDRNGWFVVEGGRTRTKYRIRSGTVVANVDVMDKADRTTHRLCGHIPVDRVPPGDQMLAQKIMIELAEDDFLRVANRHAA